MRLRWDASPWLLVPVPVLAAPAAALWIGAALQAVGLGRPLDAFVVALGASGGAEPTFGTRVLVLVLFFGGELAIEDWTIDARLRLPRPPWRVVHVIAAALLIFTALLVLAVAAHGISG